MRVFYTDQYVLPLPDGHTFPMAKYRLLRERVEAAGLVPVHRLSVPHAATDEELLRVHAPEYLRRVIEGTLSADKLRRLGFPWSPQLVERSRRSSGATIEAARAALDGEVGVNLAGGTHHAFRDRGEGYCLFNDAAVAIRAMQAEGRIRRAVVIDCDVHQGNGTASIFAGDDTVFTFSIQGRNNYPLRKETSDLDVNLPDRTTDEAYLEELERGVSRAVRESGADLAIYLAGADPFADDRLGRLAVSKAGLAERDRIVFDYLHSAGVPFAVVMAGGYARKVEDTVDIHFATVRTAAEG